MNSIPWAVLMVLSMLVSFGGMYGPIDPLDLGCVGSDASGPAQEVVLVRVSSPESSTIRVEGNVSSAGLPLTIDGAPAAVIDGCGPIDVSIEGVADGRHDVCVGETCTAVFVVEDAYRHLERDQAMARAVADVLAEWSWWVERSGVWELEVSGPMAGRGGSTNHADSRVTIHAQPGRTRADYSITLLHEFGHVAHGELGPDAQAALTDLRGPPRAESTVADHDQRWQQATEDTAEPFVAAATEGRHRPRSIGFYPPLAAPDLETVAALFDLDDAALDELAALLERATQPEPLARPPG